MKLQNRDIFVARQPLLTLANIKLPVKAAFQVAKLANILNEHLKAIEDVRSNLIKEYGEKGENNQFGVKPESANFEKFMQEFEELLEQEVEVIFDKVKLPETITATCDACKHNMDKSLEIEPLILMALEKFITVT